MIFLYIKKYKIIKGYIALGILLVSLIYVSISYNNGMSTFYAEKKKIPIYSVATKEKKVAITFDASWGQDRTDKIIEVLDRYNVKATFFLVGAWIDSYPDKLKTLYDKGHEIANHTNRHPDMSSITRQKLINEIEITDTKIKSIIGINTELFRCPSGYYNNLVVETVEGTKHYCIQWDVDSLDWKAEGADKEYERVIKKTVPGSIILFHNEAINTPNNLPRIIEYLKKQGYEFVTVSNLIYKNNYYIDHNGKQIYNSNNSNIE